jgi:hypothetical protein
VGILPVIAGEAARPRLDCFNLLWYINRLRKTMFERRFDFSSLKNAAIICHSCYNRYNRHKQPAGSPTIPLKTNLNLTCSYYNSINRICQVIFEIKSVYRLFLKKKNNDHGKNKKNKQPA